MDAQDPSDSSCYDGLHYKDKVRVDAVKVSAYDAQKRYDTAYACIDALQDSVFTDYPTALLKALQLTDEEKQFVLFCRASSPFLVVAAVRPIAFSTVNLRCGPGPGKSC